MSSNVSGRSSPCGAPSPRPRGAIRQSSRYIHASGCFSAKRIAGIHQSPAVNARLRTWSSGQSSSSVYAATAFSTAAASSIVEPTPRSFAPPDCSQLNRSSSSAVVPMSSGTSRTASSGRSGSSSSPTTTR